MASLAQCGSRSVETRPARIAAVSRLVGVAPLWLCAHCVARRFWNVRRLVGVRWRSVRSVKKLSMKWA
jgi:hypothetical protein